MAITQIYEKFVQGDDIAITITTDEDNTGYTCQSKIENVDRVTVGTFTSLVTPPYDIALTMPSLTTSGIPAGKYLWDVKIITPQGKKVTVVTGIIEFIESS